MTPTPEPAPTADDAADRLAAHGAARGHLERWRAAQHVGPAGIDAAVTHWPLRPEAPWAVAQVALLRRAAGALCLAAGIVFFFAYNWQDLSAMGRFALLGALVSGFALAGAVAPRPAATASLFLGLVATGAWLATIGQTYQTGADAWQLFAAWAALGTLWAWAAQAPPPWWLVFALAELAVLRYLNVHVGLGLETWVDAVFSSRWLSGALLHAVAALGLLAAWEALARWAPTLGLRGLVGPRALAALAAGAALWLGITALFGTPGPQRVWPAAADSLTAFALLGALAAYALRGRRDLFALACALYAAALLAVLTLGEWLGASSGTWAVLAVLLIALSVVLTQALMRLAGDAASAPAANQAKAP